MYRRKEDIIEALKEGKSNSHSIRTQISKYLKKKDLTTLLMFLSAIEEYDLFDKDERETLQMNVAG